MEAPLLSKKSPSTYPLDRKLPPPSKRCSSFAYSTFFEIYKVPTCWKGCLHYQKSTLNFVYIFNDSIFLQYEIFHILMFQVLHFIFLHPNFWFICQNLYPHLFVIRYSSTLLAYFIYEYIFNLWIVFYLRIHYR